MQILHTPNNIRVTWYKHRVVYFELIRKGIKRQTVWSFWSLIMEIGFGKLTPKPYKPPPPSPRSTGLEI